MEKDIINSIIEKEFIELTADERAELFEYCASEEEYMQLKNMFTRIENMDFENPAPRAETKRDLDLLFDQSYPKANQIWYSSLLSVVIPREKPVYRQPLLQIAAVALLIFLAVPLFNSKITDSKTQVAKVEQSAEEKTTTDKNSAFKDKNEQVVVEESEDQADLESSESNLERRTANPISGSNPLDETRFFSASRLDAMPDLGAAGITFDGTVSISDHPDGVFMGGTDGKIAFSQPASETSDLMDLLTTAF